MKPTFFVDIIVPLAVPLKYTYRVPQELIVDLEVGKRALVQFGKSRIYTGIIYSIHEQAPKNYTAKYIEAILDNKAIVTKELLNFWEWIGFYYCSAPGEVMNAALPSGLKLSSTSHIQLNAEFNLEEVDHAYFNEKEHKLLDALNLTPSLSFDDVIKLLNIKTIQPTINSLIKKNAILIYEEVKDKYKPKLQAYVALNEKFKEESELHALLNTLEKKAFKQAEALLLYLHLSRTNSGLTNEWISKNHLSKTVDNAAISALIKKEILLEQQVEVGRLLFAKQNLFSKTLSDSQQQALKKCQEAFNVNKPVLLHGVTGSGKTEIYIELIKDKLQQNKTTLLLVPEIALTTQLITRLRAAFGGLVGVYHSRFSENERVEIWNNVLNNEGEKKYKIILGTRSALFLPFQNLGLVIVDEEHDPSFKQQEPSPRYNARDSALYLCSNLKANILLGSATPSIESYTNAQDGKYEYVTLNSQFEIKGGTKIEVCDVTYFEQTQQMKASLTPPLFNAIENALKQKKQVILFQNRRGFAPYTECKTCGHVPQCVQCDVSLIYHKNSQKLSCHYCGYNIIPPKVCAACGNNQLVLKGMGTEKIEEDIEILFPNAKIARMDLDSTRSKYAYKQLIDDFELGETQILIGTQMVTKGLDFKNVGVVGVLNADSLLNFPDFRSFERSFQLLTQVRGRAGRDKEVGSVYIQTTKPTHLVINHVLNGTLTQFYKEITDERKLYSYPPYTRLFEINVISKDKNEVDYLSNELFKMLNEFFKGQILGPEYPLVSKIKNSFYKRLVLKTSKTASPKEIRGVLYDAINTLQSNHKNWNYKISINVDPV